MDYELIVIGAGPGGCSAALYGAREGLTTLLVEPAAPGGQMSVTAWVENYPGVPGASGQDLANAMLAGAKAAGATFLQAQVTGLHLTGSPKIVETTRGAYTAGAVVLAMGAAPRKLALPEAERFLGRGLSYCATCDGMFFRNKDVAVLGGGNGAAASARSLARLCRQVHVIFRKEHMSAEAREQEALAACPNVIWEAGQFMICQRPAHKARGLKWEFVGGKVEPGETKEQALIRECREELAVTVSVGEVFMDVVHEYPDLTVHLTLFHASIAEGVPQKLEHNDIRWITVEEIDQYEFCPADEVILDRLRKQNRSEKGARYAGLYLR